MSDLVEAQNDKSGTYIFYCPGCKGHHAYYTKLWEKNNLAWRFNGDPKSPTFTPSLLVNGGKDYVNRSKPKCHLFMTAGKIRYLNDCTHDLAGKTVDMEPVDWSKEGSA